LDFFAFVIDQPGVYELSASYPAAVQGQQEQEQGPQIVLAVFHSSAIEKLFGSIMGTVGGVLAIAFVPFAVGVAIIVIAFLKRRRQEREQGLSNKSIPNHHL
jgi:putative exporter of polyketide antibiotics